MSNPNQSSPYLRQQWKFPYDDIKELARQVDQAYIDIALKMNARTVGTFALQTQVVTGEKWNLQGSSKEQQTLRKVFTFTSTSSIAHGIDLSTVTYFTSCFGSFFDGTNWNGLIWGSSSATTIPGQISFYVDPANIVFRVDGAAPAVTKGVLVLTYLSQF